MKNVRRSKNFFLRLQRLLLLPKPVFLLLFAMGVTDVAQGVTGNPTDVSGDLNIADHTLPRDRIIYEINWLSSTIQAFTLRGAYLGVFNALGNTVIKFTRDGASAVFADRTDGLAQPFDLAFDAAGNLYVSNGLGGPTHTGSVLKFIPGGVGSVFADSGFHRAVGLAFDVAGTLYVSNMDSNTIEKFAPDGTDLGVFASTGLNQPFGLMFDSAGNLYAANRGSDTIEKFSSTGADLGVFANTYPKPHLMTMFRPSQQHLENEALKIAGKVATVEYSK